MKGRIPMPFLMRSFIKFLGFNGMTRFMNNMKVF